MPWHPWGLRYLLDGRPTVGWLMDLCDENYRYFLKLAPGLRRLKGQHLSRLDGSVDLYLEILEQTPYTTLVHLTYYFDHLEGQRPDPDATLRIYHDARQVELVDLRQRSLPLDKDIHHLSLKQKWKANLFLSKWLAYCVQQGHRFSNNSTENAEGPLTTIEA